MKMDNNRSRRTGRTARPLNFELEKENEINMKKMTEFFIISLLVLSLSVEAKENYYFTHAAVSPNKNQLIVCDIWSGGADVADYVGHPKNSKLYTFPLDCNKYIDLIPCDNYLWSSDGRFFSGYKIKFPLYECEIYLYDKNGKLMKQIKNGYGYSFLWPGEGDFPGLHAFYREFSQEKERNAQVVQYDFQNDREIPVIIFGNQFTFYDPIDHDGWGFPSLMDYNGGGFRGIVYKVSEGFEQGDFNGFKQYTFVVSPKNKLLMFWLEGNHMGHLPDVGFQDAENRFQLAKKNRISSKVNPNKKN